MLQPDSVSKMVYIGEVFRHLMRAKCHKDIRDFARAADMSTSTLNELFKKRFVRDVTPGTFRSFAKGAGMSVQELDAALAIATQELKDLANELTLVLPESVKARLVERVNLEHRSIESIVIEILSASLSISVSRQKPTAAATKSQTVLHRGGKKTA